jgi:integrase
MKGSIKRRGSSWRGRVEVGVDPATGARKWRSVTRRTKQEVEDEITNISAELQKGTYVDASKVTFAEWLSVWFETAIAGQKRPKTCERYRGIIDGHLVPALRGIPLQKLRAVDLERYYQASKLSPSGLELHHVVIQAALASAKRKHLVVDNEAQLVDVKPWLGRTGDGGSEVREHCWTREESLAFLRAAKEAGPGPAAFYSLLLEIGLRRNEAAGLLWKHIDLEAATLYVEHQLTVGGSSPEFGPLKSGAPRTLDISAELVDLLRAHRSHQAALKLRNRGAYHDHALVFCREWKDLTRGRASLGDPLLVNNIGQREFAKLVKVAEVRRIKFHGLRHTSATLALLAGVPLKVVSFRLGHANVGITADVYSHAIAEVQKDAARKMGALLHG